MRRFFRWVINKFLNRQLDLRVRLFNVLAMAGMIIGFMMSVFGLFTNAGFWNVLANLITAALAFMLLYYSYKSGKYQQCYMFTTIIIFLIFFPILFFTSGGYHSGMPSFFVFAVLFTVFMLEGKKTIVMATIEIIVYIAICLAAYAYPQSVHFFETEQEFLTDVIIGFSSVSLALGVTMYIHFEMYNKQQHELEQARQKLLEENAILEHVNQLKSEFLANISHELRTPLTIVSGYSQTAKTELAELPGAENVADMMTLIASEAERMSLMVGQILDVTRIDENRMVLTPAECSLTEVIQNTLSTYYPILNRNNNKLSLKLPGDLPKARADAARVSQVLVNLIANAIRHTNRGQIVVSAATQGNFIEVAVADNGEGIASERIPLLFERYKSRDSANSTRGRNTGTGLGLFICKHIVEAHGGCIWVESCEGAGTTVRFTLPKFIKSDPSC